MKNLKRLGTAVVLTCLLGASAFAIEPCAPGQISTPCAASQMATPGDMGTPTLGSTALGQTDRPPSSDISLDEIAASVLRNLLSLF